VSPGRIWLSTRPRRRSEIVVKLLFAPFRIAGGVLAGIVGKRVFDRVWRLIDAREVPNPARPGVTWPKLAAALLLQGAILRASRGLFDHGARQFFKRLTGRWPGEEDQQAV
jgi:hypothetical protein